MLPFEYTAMSFFLSYSGVLFPKLSFGLALREARRTDAAAGALVPRKCRLGTAEQRLRNRGARLIKWLG